MKITLVHKIAIFLLITVNSIFLFYLFTPLPKIPDLPNSVLSTEPGDTIQLKDVKAFFTNSYRFEVISFYDTQFKKYIYPYLKLNHPPEYARQIYRDTTQSYYLEEYVFPLKGSIFVNGFEWENDVFTKPEKRVVNKFIVNEQEYKSKVTIKWIYANPFYSIFYILLVQLFIYLLFKYIFKFFKKLK